MAISEHTDPNHVLDEVKTKILRERILRYHQVIKELNLVNAKLKILRNHLHQMPELPSRNVLLDRVGKLDEMLTYPENVITALDDIKDKRQYYDLLKVSDSCGVSKGSKAVVDRNLGWYQPISVS